MTRITESQMVHYGNLVEWVVPARMLLRSALDHIPPTEVTLIRKIEALLATETVPKESSFREEQRMSEFKQYRRKTIAELRPYQSGDDMSGVSISGVDKEAGSPKEGDMIARNPKNHDDKWLVAAAYFADNFESF